MITLNTAPLMSYDDYLNIIFSSPNNTFIPLSFLKSSRWNAATAIKICIDNDGIITYVLVRYRTMNDKSKYELYTSNLQLYKKKSKYYKLKGYTLIDDVPITLSFKVTKHGCISVRWQRVGYIGARYYVLEKDMTGLLTNV